MEHTGSRERLTLRTISGADFEGTDSMKEHLYLLE